MLMLRKEAKTHGSKKLLEGVYRAGDMCLVVEDVATTGSSIVETMECLKAEGLIVKDVVVILDRGQGARNKLKPMGINLHSVLTLNQILDVLESANRIDAEFTDSMRKYLADMQFKPMLGPPPGQPTVPVPLVVSTPERYSPSAKRKLDDVANGSSNPERPSSQVLMYVQRAQMCSHPVTRQLFLYMMKKRTNLALSLDVTTCKKALELVDLVGPHICLVKTHVDILDDFSPHFIEQLITLSKHHGFIIFEDRKFADIGSTVSKQYGNGIFKIAEWSHVVNAHALPGDGVIRGLKEVGLKKDRACLLIAEMSSSGNLANGTYTQSCLKMADEHDDFVIGFICQQKLSDNPEFVHMTPGVRLERGQTRLGQIYSTPETVIGEKHSDIIIVGRGIIDAEDQLEEAKRYQQAGFNAYEELLNCQMG